MTERTPLEKLAGIKVELVTLKPRLTEPYRSNLETLIQWCGDLETHLTPAEADDGSASLTITCEDNAELDTICNVLQEAEQEGAIDFAFGVRRS